MLVQRLVERWWGQELRAGLLRDQGNALFHDRQVQDALRKYDEAVLLGECRKVRVRHTAGWEEYARPARHSSVFVNSAPQALFIRARSLGDGYDAVARFRLLKVSGG